jgi:hypothetical protein
VARAVKEGVGVVGGEALVEEMDGEGGMCLMGCFRQSFSEGLSFGGLRAGCAVGVEGIADQKDFYFVLADEAGDGFEICAESGPVESEEWLRGETEGIGDGETDAAVANI